jgi:hypothetical protein
MGSARFKQHLSLLVVLLMVFGLLGIWATASAADRVGNVPYPGKTMAKKVFKTDGIQVQGVSSAEALVQALVGKAFQRAT